MKFKDIKTPADMRAFVAGLEAETQANFAAHWLTELADAIWLRAQWELEACTWTIPREEWDTESYRRYFAEDMAEYFDPVRDGWVDKNTGRP